MTTRLGPEGLPAPRGFSHVVLAGPGRLVFLAGQAGQLPDGSLVSGDLVEQFEQACRNLALALEAAGGTPSDLVQLQIFVTEPSAYRAAAGPIGEAYRRVLGPHYPAVALVGVTELFDRDALVEMLGVAVVPDRAVG